ncbi:MAG: hypothetical protein ACRBEE_03190 [Arenicella sp.]
MKFLLTILSTAFILAACGSGDSSTSSGSAGDPSRARACIDFDRDREDGDDITEFYNECDFDVNVAELDGGSDEPTRTVKANSRLVIEEYFTSWGACLTPYIVNEDRPFNYRCTM